MEYYSLCVHYNSREKKHLVTHLLFNTTLRYIRKDYRESLGTAGGSLHIRSLCTTRDSGEKRYVLQNSSRSIKCLCVLHRARILQLKLRFVSVFSSSEIPMHWTRIRNAMGSGVIFPRDKVNENMF